MKIRNVLRHGEEKVELQMTPMIDIVFQLLAFFIMTFKIVSPEGDFNIKMPLAAPSDELPTDIELPPIRISLRATDDGGLASVALGERMMDSRRPFEELHLQIRAIVGDDRGPGSVAATTEVELDCDYQLKFEYVIAAITAVSGYVADDGRSIVKLIEKINFTPPDRE